MKYRFQFAKKAELRTRKGNLIVLSATPDGPTYTLNPAEFSLVELFDGVRSNEEVLDKFYQLKGLRVMPQHLEEFISSLLTTGLLAEIETKKPTPRLRLPTYRQMARTGTGYRSVVSRAPHRVDEAPEERGHSIDLPNDQAPTPPPLGDIRRLRAVRIGEETVDETDTTNRLIDAVPILEARDRDDAHAEATVVEGEMLEPEFRRGPSPRHRPRSGQQPTSARRGPRIVLKLPVRWLIPLGKLLNVTLLGWPLFGLVILASILSFYGIWVNRLEFFRDLGLLFVPLNLAQSLLLSMVTVNLLSQVARAAALHSVTGRVPEFGIVLIFSFVPRFFTDLSELSKIRDAKEQRRVIGSLSNALLIVFVVASFAWFMTKNSATILPLLYAGIATLAFLLFLLGINPLGRRDGYFLISTTLGVPGLREQALASLRGKTPPKRPGARSVSPWALRVYGLMIVAFIATIAVAITMGIGGWLEAHWGGLGVIVFLTLAALVLRDPTISASQSKSLTRRGPVAVPVHQGGPTTRRKKSRPLIRPVFIYALVLTLLACAGLLPYTFEPGGDFVILPADRADVRALISGDIRSIYVAEGDVVEKDQILARLADDEEQKNMRVSEAKLEELGAELSMAQQGATAEQLAVAQQKVKTAKTRADFSRERANRLGELIKRKVVSQQQYEDALSQAEVDAALLAEAREELSLVRSGTRPEQIEAIEAAIAKEEAQLSYHQKQLAYTELRAGISGRIVSGSLQFAVGDYLEKGDLLATIESTDTVQAEIKVPEADSGEVLVGAPVRVKAWAQPHREFHGVVRRVAPTAQPGDYGKVVRVVTEIDNHEGLLKSELTGYAKIRGETQPAALAFTRMLVRFFQVELWSWLP